jgi:hypothetical protein
VHISKIFKVPRSRQVGKKFLLRAVAAPRTCKKIRGIVGHRSYAPAADGVYFLGEKISLL